MDNNPHEEGNSSSATDEDDETVQPESTSSSSSQSSLPPAETEELDVRRITLKPSLLKGIREKGLQGPSLVQEYSIRFALAGRDILARSKIGTMKTTIFCVPVLEKTDPDKSIIQAVILVPTQELALQTAKFCKEVGKHMDVRVMVLEDDIMRLYQPVHLLVGTPGSILALAKRGACILENCAMLVMDEADELLSLEFQPEVERLIDFMPENRQILMFTETFDAAVREFRDRCLHKPYIADLMDGLTLKGVTHFYVIVEESHKVHSLNTLFSKLQINQSVIFCKSVKRVEILAKKMTELGYSFACMHTKMLQDHHERAFNDFVSGACRNLVSNDLFNKGTGFQAVNVVINFDCAENSEIYLHRVGRTGKFAQRRLAVNLITNEDCSTLYGIERELGIESEPIPDFIHQVIYRP